MKKSIVAAARQRRSTPPERAILKPDVAQQPSVASSSNFSLPVMGLALLPLFMLLALSSWQRSESLVRHGQELFEDGKVEAATRTFQRAVSLLPDSGMAYTRLGISLVASGRRQEALEQYMYAGSDLMYAVAPTPALVRWGWSVARGEPESVVAAMAAAALE